MRDFFEDLYDDEQDAGEPSFSFNDFKKWLSKQPKTEKLSESVERKKKEALKDKFKQKFKDKLKHKKKD